MKYAIVSDIHANLQAWRAVRVDMASLGVQRIICLGDVVGYGPNPAETLEALYAEVHHFVLGNHDAVICGKMDEDLFHERARAMIQWTRAQLSDAARRVFSGWPLTLRGPGFRCAHGDFSAPSLFQYVIDAADAAASWQAVEEPLLFVGHSHRPGIYLLGASGTPRRVDPQDAVLEEGKRFLVNVGSVGQPRDGDPRASYFLFDSEAKALFYRRVAYDVDAYREAVRRAGLPEAEDVVLQADPRLGTAPLRPLLSFRPPTDARRGARDCVAVAETAELRRRVRSWRAIALALAGLVFLGAMLGAWWAKRRHEERPERLDRRPPLPLVAADYPVSYNFATFSALPPEWNTPPDGWAIERGNRKRQTIRWERDAEGSVRAVLQSEIAGSSLFLTGARLHVAKGQRFTFKAFFRKSSDWQGNVGLQVSLERETPSGRETLRNFVVKEPTRSHREGWQSASVTFEIPAGGQAIEWRIGGTFSGSVEISEISLERK